MEIKLKMVIGAILSDISVARSVSDIKTVELAAVYNENALLKQLSVPRMEITNIEIELKAAVVGLGSENETMVEIAAADLQELRPESLTNIRFQAKIQNYALHRVANETQLIPTN